MNYDEADILANSLMNNVISRESLEQIADDLNVDINSLSNTEAHLKLKSTHVLYEEMLNAFLDKGIVSDKWPELSSMSEDELKNYKNVLNLIGIELIGKCEE